MFKKFGGALKRLGRKAKIAATLMSVATVTAITTVIASAEEPTTTVGSTYSLSSVISDAAASIKDTLTTLVSTLAPVLVSVSVSGLGIYAIIMLFTLAKKLFKKAAG